MSFDFNKDLAEKPPAGYWPPEGLPSCFTLSLQEEGRAFPVAFSLPHEGRGKRTTLGRQGQNRAAVVGSSPGPGFIFRCAGVRESPGWGLQCLVTEWTQRVCVCLWVRVRDSPRPAPSQVMDPQGAPTRGVSGWRYMGLTLTTDLSCQLKGHP